MNSTLRSLLRDDFLSFARKALREIEGLTIDGSHICSYLAHEFALFAEKKTINHLLINLPPGHLKDSLGSVCFAAWLLAHDPTLKLIVVSHAEHLSKEIARKIRAILHSAWFREIFSDTHREGPRRGLGFRYDVGRWRVHHFVSGELHRPARRCDRRGRSARHRRRD